MTGAVRFEDVTNLASGATLYREVLFPIHCTKGFSDSVQEFFNRSEYSGMVVWLDRAMIEFALDQLQEHEQLHLGVNLSYTTIAFFGHSIVRRVKAAGKRIARRLIVEITETALTRNEFKSGQVFADLRQLGVRLAIDDFGAGHHNGPVPSIGKMTPDIIKIDGGVIRNYSTQSNQRRIESAVSYGRKTGAAVIAEHIESRDILDAVTQMGIIYGQGHLVGAAGGRRRMHENTRKSIF